MSRMGVESAVEPRVAHQERESVRRHARAEVLGRDVLELVRLVDHERVLGKPFAVFVARGTLPAASTVDPLRSRLP